MIFFSARQDEEVPGDEAYQPTVSASKSADSDILQVSFYLVSAIGKLKVGNKLPNFGFVTNIRISHQR